MLPGAGRAPNLTRTREPCSIPGMGSQKGIGALAGSAVALALGLSASPAAAQDSRFGQRDEFIFSVERIFGFQNQKFDDDGGSYEATGFHPLYWAGLGLFSVSSSGLSFGALLGATRFEYDLGGSDEEVSATVLQLRPRIGYGGTEKEGRFGYWVRVGPGALFAFSEDDSQQAFSVGGEGYVVLFPAPHVGILVGPHADFHLAGSGDGDPYYRTYGLTAGIMGEFY